MNIVSGNTHKLYVLRSKSGEKVAEFFTEQLAKQWASDQLVEHGDACPIYSLSVVYTTIIEEVICDV
uniref:Uncharacterized protein n=1 Tax=Pseudomonas phage Arace01 TaxID=3138526 RepID=A0AAU6VZ75_9VIRU